MWLKFLLGALFLLSLLGVFFTRPAPRRDHEDTAAVRASDGRRLRLMSWNVGYGDLEADTRAHAEDLNPIAQVILNNDVDAVALQELTGEDQLKLLLTHLKNRYRGDVCSRGASDRVEAVLVKNYEQGEPNKQLDRQAKVNFTDVPAGNRFAAAATFQLSNDAPKIVLVSAHADAFSASRRRTFAADLTDWARSQDRNGLAFIAGDFNLEVSTRNRNNLFTDDATNDSETYAYLLKYFRDLGLAAGETAINERRIDYVFGPTAGISLRRAEVLRSAAVGRMDHWPLLIEVAF
jgi:endonuclease/exonuclease/phosphatase family metal-dependent hydrolase